MQATEGWAWIDGHLSRVGEARVPVLDHGFLYGDSVYEAVRTYGGRPFLLDEHLARLGHSARGLHIPMPADIPRAVAEVLAADDAGERLLRIIVTRGIGPLSYAIQPDQKPTLVILSLAAPVYPERLYDEGMRLAVVGIRRNPYNSLDPALKTSNLLNLRLAFMEARERGADDAILLNHEGDVAECSGSNLFLVRDGRLATPPTAAGILQGITRGFVLDVAREAGVETRERRISRAELADADEMFITSTTRSIMPATVVDDRPVGTGKPGPVTRLLMRRFEEKVGA